MTDAMKRMPLVLIAQAKELRSTMRPNMAVETPKSWGNFGRIGATTPCPIITRTVEIEIISSRSC